MALNRIRGLIFHKLPGLNVCSFAGSNASGYGFPLLCSTQNIHLGTPCYEPKKWSKQNEVVYPIQKPGEPRREAWNCHHGINIKYSPKKMWYIASLIRDMYVDEALKQLSFIPSKGAAIITEVLLEAKELAVKEHNVEYSSNLWVAESFVGKGVIFKGLRKHARMRFGIIKYRHCHYFVRLVEGPPPPHGNVRLLTGNEKLQEYLGELRNRRILRTS